MLTEGDKLPQLPVIDDQGKSCKTTDLLQDHLVVYFYPKDDTPGCTSEASQFRDLYAQFQNKRASIVGVSSDSVESHQKFKKKFSIPFPLIADTSSALRKAFGAQGVRATFLFDAKGRLVRVWPKVKVDGHPDEVLAAIL